MSPANPRTHLTAFALALVVASALAACALFVCKDIEVRFIHAVATDLSDLKLQGVALQKEAFKNDDLLVLYGSSELVKDVPNRASEFFEPYPTGFRVFPVGKAGTVSLAILQKIASVGGNLKGKKVALSLSPSFFFDETVNSEYYDGNFSALQASELAFSTSLSPELRRDAAKRMRLYPDTLAENWTLDFAVERLAGDSLVDRALYVATWPLGKLTNAVGRAQDHIEAGIQISAENQDPDAKPAKIAGINWREVIRIANASKKRPPASRLTQRPKGSRDASFVASLTAADEWDDFELILRTFRELGARPLCSPCHCTAQIWKPPESPRKHAHATVKSLQNSRRRMRLRLCIFRSLRTTRHFGMTVRTIPAKKGGPTTTRCSTTFSTNEPICEY